MSKIATTLPILLLSFSTLHAQEDRGTTTGTATDSAGALIPNAQVTALNTQTNVPDCDSNLPMIGPASTAPGWLRPHRLGQPPPSRSRAGSRYNCAIALVT